MYERNAIILERYFDKMFGYNMKNNIKTNFIEYSEIVKCLEDYRNISEDEETIMQEYDSIANKIREIQRTQENLNKRNLKLQEERTALFQNIDERAENIQKKLELINNNIYNIDEEIKENASNFVEIIAEFTEKTSTRTSCERTRRNVENEYNRKLNRILDDYKEIDINREEAAKQFIQTDTEEIEEELKEKIQKNGEKEKIPFNMDVITKAICLSVDIQKRETEILAGIYEKTSRLFTEIKNNTVKLDKHKKIIKDSSSRLEFISAIKEYLFQFLDNERLTAVNGEEEHNKLMQDACKHLDEDLVQINNLYTLLLKEISKKITKKSYTELYKVDYLKELEKKSDEFDKEVKKLNLPVTVINPNYWRIEGMKRIYNVFYKCVTENYARDLSEYVVEEKIKIKDDFQDDFEQEEEEEIEEILKKQEDPIEDNEKREIKDNKEKTTNKKKKDSVKEELDKKIDMILGFNNDILKNNNNKKTAEVEDNKNDDDDWEDEDSLFADEIEEDEDIFDEDDEDIWDDDDEDVEIDDIWDDDEDDDEDWNNNEIEENEENWDDDDDIKENIEEIEDEKEIIDDISEKEKKNKKDKKNNKNSKTNDEEDWENEFIKIDKKVPQGKHKKKSGFFDKFKNKR